MVNFPGRSDRRRRVLKEEVLSATSSRSGVRSQTDSDAQAARYSEAAGVENHPQITDFVPRRYGTVALLVLCGSALTAFSAAVHYFVVPLAAAHGITSTAAFDLSERGNVSEWLSAIVLFVAAGFCVITYSIRRHRIDDIRGRYRVWLGAALACLVLSANSVTGLHQVLADLLGQFAGWTALRDGAVWWLAVAGLPLAWIFVRVLLDTRECSVAAALLVGAFICYAVSASRFFGYGPAVDARIEPILVSAPLLSGHWLVFVAVVAYARYVVLDAQGLVTVGRRAQSRRTARPKNAKQSSSSTAQPVAAATSMASRVALARQTVQPAKHPADSSEWVDGTRPERKNYEEDDDDSPDGNRKLSKSDRKRLRKLKSENRAA